MDAQLDFTADLQRRTHHPVERVVDRTFGGVLDGHDSEIGEPGLDFVKHFVHRGQRQRTHRVPEMFERRGL